MGNPAEQHRQVTGLFNGGTKRLPRHGWIDMDGHTKDYQIKCRKKQHDSAYNVTGLTIKALAVLVISALFLETKDIDLRNQLQQHHHRAEQDVAKPEIHHMQWQKLEDNISKIQEED